MNGLMRTVQNFFQPLLARFSRVHAERAVILAFGLIALFTLGNAWLGIKVIAPGLDARATLAVSLQEERQHLLDARRLSEESPESLQTRIEASKATVTASQSLFLDDAQVIQIVNALYQNAKMSGIALSDLTVQDGSNPVALSGLKTTATPTNVRGIKPTAKPNARITPTATVTIAATPSLYQLSVIHMQAQGSSQRLINFMARMTQVETRGVVVNTLLMQGTGELATLTIDVSLYVSPFATSSPQSIQAVRSVITTVPPTMTPTAANIAVAPLPTPDRFYVYFAKDGDTLSGIATQFGVSAQEIVNTNAMTKLELAPGQRLLVPVR